MQRISLVNVVNDQTAPPISRSKEFQLFFCSGAQRLLDCQIITTIQRVSRLQRPAIQLLAGALLATSGCQTDSGGVSQRDIRTSLRTFKNSLNSHNYNELESLLAPEIQIDGLTDEMSKAGLRAGMLWTPNRIEDIQLLSTAKSAGELDARVALYMTRGVLSLKIGFDPTTGKIRSISGDPLWGRAEVKLPATFRTGFTRSGGLLFVHGKVNGRAGYLLFDTGSSHLLLNRKYFAPDTDHGVGGITINVHGLRRPLGHARVDEIRWGGLVAQDRVGELHDFSEMERAEITPLLGAISHDELADCAVAFDIKRGFIEVFSTRRDGSKKIADTGPPPIVREPFTMFLHLPMIPVTIGGREWPALFDSGAGIDLLPDAGGLGGHFRATGQLGGFSDGGKSEAVSSPAPSGVVGEMRIGSAIYRDLPFVIHGVPYLPGKAFLGTPWLERGRVEINFRSKQISLWQ